MNDGYILLVEDREEDIELTLRSFKRARISNEIVIKRDGVEALDFLKSLVGPNGEATGDIPALILLDVNMPRMNGIMLLEKLRKLSYLRYVPVVMHTTSNEERDLVASYDSGANSYIRKPTASIDFSAVIACLGSYWVLTNETPSRPNGP